MLYAGSVERTSFAEAPETKGYMTLELTRSGLGKYDFHPLPARPMVALPISLAGLTPAEAFVRVASAIESTPADAVVQLRISGAVPPAITAQKLRELAGARNVTLAGVGWRQAQPTTTFTLPAT